MSHFHPELRRAARLIPRFSFGPRLSRLAKGLQRRRGLSAPPSAEGLAIRDEFIPGPDGSPLRVKLYIPAAAQPALPAILWMHGGGFIIGTPEQDEARHIALCLKVGLVIAAVDYRLSPEHPYPAPLADGYAALAWLHSEAGRLNIAPDRIAVAGNSAGAGLAAGLVLMAHDRAEFRVAFQLLIYPMLDDRTACRTDIDERRLRLWSTESNRFGWRSYLGREPGGPDVPAYASPARREDLRGLPPTWIGVGDCDLFHDESIAYARRLTEAGVPCTLTIVEGAFHVFDLVGAKTEVVRDFHQRYTEALSKALCRG
ncbi:MAG: esterase LipW [Caulobacter sp.]|nr:esterase LipW [Caulobacter sp.]